MADVTASKKKVIYPYMHPKGSILYVTASNKFMHEAWVRAKKYSLDKTMPTGAIVVRDGNIIGCGANGSDYHEKFGCERVRLNIPTGQNYELCEGCNPKNHAEQKALENAKKTLGDTTGAEIYLWGHWWACESCWKAMISSGIFTVYLLTGSDVLFNKKAVGNIVGRQFT